MRSCINAACQDPEGVHTMNTIIAANWKMNKTREEAKESVSELFRLIAGADLPETRRVFVFTPFTCIADAAEAAKANPKLLIGGQDVYPADHGAFTGEISPAMLRDAGARWVLAGHSERRHIIGENDDFVAEKTAFALQNGLSVMLCIGETLQEREDGQLKDVLLRQLTVVANNLKSKNLVGSLPQTFAVAYEPVWAIGTGKVAGEAEVLDAHAAVRSILEDLLGPVGKQLPILYGGSVKPANAASLLKLDNVDGLLVGGASLEAKTFMQIVAAQ